MNPEESILLRVFLERFSVAQVRGHKELKSGNAEQAREAGHGEGAQELRPSPQKHGKTEWSLCPHVDRCSVPGCSGVCVRLPLRTREGPRTGACRRQVAGTAEGCGLSSRWARRCGWGRGDGCSPTPGGLSTTLFPEPDQLLCVCLFHTGHQVDKPVWPLN